MELKVWVDGVQRVVCGITKQTTVQEVVIALAQATGRTGRYTLVEKSRNAEKMLPPSEHPIQVLTKWGERSNEIQFILRRTGASSVMNEGSEEGVVMPERTSYRQSLPPQLKHRQKNEAILNRKEPKRKSLTMPAAPVDGSNKYKSTPIDRKNEAEIDKRSNGRITPGSPKKAMIPPPFRSQPIMSQKSVESSKQSEELSPNKKEALMPLSSRNEISSLHSPPKKALMPPQARFNSSASRLSSASENQGFLAERTNTGIEQSPSKQHSFQGLPSKPVVHTRSLDSVKARTEFTRLVLEQQAHVNEQNLTLKNLDEEMEKYEAAMQKKEQQAVLLKTEIENLEKSIQEKEADINNEQLLEGLVIDEGSKGNNLHNENSKFKLEVTAVEANIKELEKHILFLQEEIQQEQNIQTKRNEEMKSYRMEAAEVELRRISSEMRKAEAEVESLDDVINRKDAVVCEKQMKLEALNRELRQVNLQQFIRQTGSKVTVLPSDADRHALQSDYPSSPTNYDLQPDVPPLPPSSGGESGGVWV